MHGVSLHTERDQLKERRAATLAGFLDRAKTLIRHYMGKPDFMDKLNEGQSRTESGRVESVEQFKANLKKLNIPAPFDA